MQIFFIRYKDKYNIVTKGYSKVNGIEDFNLECNSMQLLMLIKLCDLAKKYETHKYFKNLSPCTFIILHL